MYSGPGPGPEVLVDVGQQDLDPGLQVLAAAPAGFPAGAVPGRVFLGAFVAAVGHRHHDQGFDLAGGNQILQGFIHLPFPREAGGGVEDVLAVEHVQHGIAALGFLVIPRGQVDPDGAAVQEVRNRDPGDVPRFRVGGFGSFTMDNQKSGKLSLGVGEIIIVGNDVTKDRGIRKALGLLPGQKISYPQVQFHRFLFLQRWNGPSNSAL